VAVAATGVPNPDRISDAMSDWPALQLLLQGYLHQDWPLDFESVWEGVDAFMSSEPGMVDALRREVEQLYEERLSDEHLRRLLIDELGSGYWPPGNGMSFSAWLTALRKHLS
jgi:hypothetical protein